MSTQELTTKLRYCIDVAVFGDDELGNPLYPETMEDYFGAMKVAGVKLTNQGIEDVVVAYRNNKSLNLITPEIKSVEMGTMIAAVELLLLNV
jgi:hypothetical protein